MPAPVMASSYLPLVVRGLQETADNEEGGDGTLGGRRLRFATPDSVAGPRRPCPRETLSVGRGSDTARAYHVYVVRDSEMH